MRLEEGLLWAEPPVDICNETTAYGHFREIASASAAKPPSPHEADDPLAFARVRPLEFPRMNAPCATRRERHDPRRIRRWPPRPGFPRQSRSATTGRLS